MGLNYSKSHIFTLGVRNACYETNSADFLNLYDPAYGAAFHRTFRETSTFQFMVDGSNKSEILYYNGVLVDTRIPFGGGTEILYTDPVNVNWVIVNRQGYLWVYLHEIDGVHSLVYRSTNRILNTWRRKHYALQFNVSTSVLTLLVESLPEPLTIDTSSGTFRTSAGSFTALQDVGSAGFLVGGGSAYFPTQKGDFTLYYDSYIDRALTQLEINAKYQVIQDTRELPPPNIGKVLISSDRIGGNGYDIYQVNGDFTDPVLKSGLAPGDMLYPTWSKNILKNDFVFIHQSVPKIFLDSDGIYNIKEFLNKTIQNSYYNNWELFSGYTLDSVSLGLDDVIDAIHYWNGYSYAKLDTNDTANSMFFASDFVAKPFTPLFMTSPFVPSARKYVDSHPVNPNKVLITNVALSGANSGICTIAEWDKVDNTLSSAIYTLSFSVTNSNSGFDNQIQLPRYNYNATRLGFTANTTIGANKHAYVCDITGSNLIDLGLDIDFLCFASEGKEWDKTYSFSRPLVSPEVVTLTLNGVILAPVPFNTDMATTLADIRAELLTQAAVGTVTIVGNTFRVLAKIDKSLDLVIEVGGNLSVITATTTTNTIGVDTEVLIQKYELSLTYAQMYYRIYKRNLRTNEEVNMSGDVPYNDYWADWKA